jgi:hypothetical protein
VALLPPIPDRPADRPETWTEYLSRRAIVAMHRQFADELAAWVTRIPPFDPFDWFVDMAGNRVPFGNLGKTRELLGTKRVPSNVVFIDEDATWREDAVRRLLADPSVTDLFVTDAGILQVTKLDIDLAPELKESSRPRKRRAGTNPTS